MTASSSFYTKFLKQLLKTTYPPLPYPQTPESVRRTFRAYGVCGSEWARSIGVPPQTLRDLLGGRALGNRGNAHRVAIALGLKPDPERSQS
jgi:gp16 family phage-associated protein